MKLKNLLLIPALVLCVSVACLFGCADNKFSLTVEDPNHFIIEILDSRYNAGESVTVKTGILTDVDLVAYINGESIGSQTFVDSEADGHWEFYFEMPARNSTLTFEVLGRPLYTSPVQIDAEIESEIKSAYAQSYNIPVSSVSLNCFGEYDNSYVLMMYSTKFGYAAVITYDNFGSVVFTYSDSNKMQVYNNGNFYSLKDACQNGLLTNNNLRQIAELISNTPSILGVWVTYLTAAEEAVITQAYYVSVKDDGIEKQDIELSANYGKYGDYIAVSIGVKGTEPYKDVIESINIEGSLFGNAINRTDYIGFSNPYGIQLYKDGEIYTLKFAVENKLISLDDYFSISEVNGFYWKSL